MGELILKAVKVGLVILLIALAGSILIQLTSVDWSGFNTLLDLIKRSFIWDYLRRGIGLGKWLLGVTPVVGIVTVGVAFTTFSIAGRFTDFIRRTFFD